MKNITFVSINQIILEKYDSTYQEPLQLLLKIATITSNLENLIQLKFSRYLFWSALSGGLELKTLISELDKWLKYPLSESIIKSLELEVGGYIKIKHNTPTFPKPISPSPYGKFPGVLKTGQADAVTQFINIEKISGGVICMPSGYGKTLTGGECIRAYGHSATILITSDTLKNQWKDELITKGGFSEESFYSIKKNKIENENTKQITLLTYSEFIKESLAATKTYPENHFLVIDEIHQIPTTIFPFLQNKLILGLTATLSIEENLQSQFFCSIGPVLYEQSSSEQLNLLKEGEILEVTFPLSKKEYTTYLLARDKNERYKLASMNSSKQDACVQLAKHFQKDQNVKFIIFGEFTKQLEPLAVLLDLPYLSGKNTIPQREKIYQKFRSGEIQGFVTSRVSNESVDLPMANTLIQLSGQKDNQVEELQRIGRLMRDKKEKIKMISFVTENTIEETSSLQRKALLEKNGISSKRVVFESLFH